MWLWKKENEIKFVRTKHARKTRISLLINFLDLNLKIKFYIIFLIKVFCLNVNNFLTKIGWSNNKS